MASYTPEELNQLVKDGIKTIELIQQNTKDPKATYGRSAIQKPGTKERAKAWESIKGDHDYGTERPRPKKRNGEGAKKGAGKRGAEDNRGVGGEKAAASESTTAESPSNDKQDRDDEDTVDRDSNDGRASNSGLHKSGKIADTGTQRNTEPERSIGDDSVSVEDLRTILSADHESSSAETTGSASNMTSIRDATTEDFAQIFEEGASKVHRRMTGIAAYTTVDEPSTSNINPVKKGIGENTVSTPLVDVQLSESGAIPDVHQILLRQPSTYAHAEGAQKSVSNVSTTGFTCENCKTPSDHQDVEGKIDFILNALDRISSKLDMLPEMKEEIKNINKKITNLSLGLSTVENYIKSMMVIIPGSGKKGQDESVEINPDLKPVIGRDNTRGLSEMKFERSTMEDLDTQETKKNIIDPKYITNPLDFTKPNASNFIPQNDYASYKTIVAMIKNEVDDLEIRISLLKWVDDMMITMRLSDIYTAVRESLDNAAL